MHTEYKRSTTLTDDGETCDGPVPADVYPFGVYILRVDVGVVIRVAVLEYRECKVRSRCTVARAETVLGSIEAAAAFESRPSVVHATP